MGFFSEFDLIEQAHLDAKSPTRGEHEVAVPDPYCFGDDPCVCVQLKAAREDERRKGSGSDYADGFAYAIREVLSVLERFDDVDELPLMLAAIRAPLKEK
jgi:hypothetical protein